MCFETVQEALAMQRVMHLRCYGENLVSANFVVNVSSFFIFSVFYLTDILISCALMAQD